MKMKKKEKRKWKRKRKRKNNITTLNTSMNGIKTIEQIENEIKTKNKYKKCIYCVK